MQKKRAITDLNGPNGSRDIPFQSQEFGQNGHRHFVGFSASFSLKYDVTDAMLQDNEKMKVQYLRSFLFDLFETLQAVRTWQRNFASFQIRCYGTQNQNCCLLLKKQNVYCLSKSDVQKVIWNNTVWLLLQVVSSFEEKWVIHSSYCEKTIVFCFWTKANYSHLSFHSNEIQNQAKFFCSLLKACIISNKSNKRLMRYCTFIFSMSCRTASLTSYLSENEAKNLQNGDVHLAQIPDFEKGYLENYLVQ